MKSIAAGPLSSWVPCVIMNRQTAVSPSQVGRNLSIETFRGATGTLPPGPTPPAPTQLNPSARTVLSVLKRCVPKTLAFAFGLRLRSKTWCFKTRVLARRLPNGKPQERLRFRALRSKTLAFKKPHCDHFLRFEDFPRGQGLRLGPLR